MASSQSIEELRKDLTEFEKFSNEATRQRVKNFLSVEIRKLSTEITQKLENQTSEGSKPAASAASGDRKTTNIYREKLTKYGWDQSDKFMKLYITINGVQNVDKSQITSEFSEHSVTLHVDGVANKNYEFSVVELCEDIDPSGSYHKIKTDMVLLMLKKKTEGKSWSHVKATEKKIMEKEKAPVSDKDEDPSQSMMKLLQKMYEEGDDEMKRTIAKSMAESQAKGGQMPMM